MVQLPKKERVWHDPPMANEPQNLPQNITLGGSIPPEVKLWAQALEKAARRGNAVSAIITAVVFTAGYAIVTTLFPELTQFEILVCFVAATGGIVIREAAFYYKIV